MNNIHSEDKDALLSFGIITDLHYMDVEDGSNYAGTKTRRFRQSLSILKNASQYFSSNQTNFNIMLGDILDGKAKSLGIHHDCLDTVLDVCTQQRWYYTLGNHEYYNFTREELEDKLIPRTVSHRPSKSCLYHEFVPMEGFRCLVLDGYDVSTIGASTVQHQQSAEALICQKNHNYAAGRSNWFDGLAEENHRYVPFNGGVSEKQVEWLRSRLEFASSVGDKCIIFSHMPLFVEASKEQNIIWNCERVLSELHAAPHGTVLACISGHDHDGGYAVDSRGIHHIVPPSPIECDDGEVSFGHLTVKHDYSLQLSWVGKLPPAKMWPDILPSPVHE